METTADVEGSIGIITLDAKVGVKNSGGYTITLKAGNTSLLADESSSDAAKANPIPSITGSPVTSSDMAINHCGYYATTDEAVSGQ